MVNQTSMLSTLQPFIDNELITDVLYVVKSGKEATVYCCEAHPATGKELLAAKVYRPRHNRNFKNDAIYREGRWIPQKSLRRAVQRKNKVGREVQFISWLGQEFKTLNRLYNAGADVPKPYAHSDSAILMEYVGDRRSPAPMLSQVSLEQHEAKPLFDLLMRNIRLWLAYERIHGDLSPFNILYWNGSLTVIDFPQAIDPYFNPSAFSLLLRDVEHICSYWARFGVYADPFGLADSLWQRYQRSEL